MRAYLLFLMLVFGPITLTAQSSTSDIRKGDVLFLGEPVSHEYTNIDFPRKNTIIKRGALADFKSLVNKKLVVQSIETKGDGTIIVTLKRKDGMNFFRFFPSVKANLSPALVSGELKVSKL